VEMAGIELML